MFDVLRVRYDPCYDNIGDEQDPCVYCGNPSTGWDHVPPLHYVSRLAEAGVNIYEYRLRKVRACKQCNATLHGQILTRITDRKSYLLEHYLYKYRKVLAVPNWSDEEVDAITGRVFQDSVKAYQKVQLHIRQRIKNLRDSHMIR